VVSVASKIMERKMKNRYLQVHIANVQGDPNTTCPKHFPRSKLLSVCYQLVGQRTETA
jgi:hypothetical protein